jgi:hypothetical protein
LIPVLAGAVMILIGVASTVMAIDGREISHGIFWTAIVGFAAGGATFLGAWWLTRGRTSQGKGLTASGVIAAAGLASLARHSPVLLQVAGLMFVTGFFASVTVANLIRLLRPGEKASGDM